MGNEKKDAPESDKPSTPSKEETVKDSMDKNPEFWDVDPNKPLPPSGDRTKH